MACPGTSARADRVVGADGQRGVGRWGIECVGRQDNVAHRDMLFELGDGHAVLGGVPGNGRMVARHRVGSERIIEE